MKTACVVILSMLLAFPVVAQVAPVTPTASAQTRLTEAEARAFAAKATAVAGRNIGKFENEFRKLVRTRIPKYQGKNVRILSIPIRIDIQGSLTTFQRNVAEQIRTFQPIEDAAWLDSPVVIVSAEQMTSPRVQKIVVTRDNEVYQPQSLHLSDHEAKNLMGAVFTGRDGWATFSVDAFAPPAKGRSTRVGVIVVPERGRNVEMIIFTGNLQKIFRD